MPHEIAMMKNPGKSEKADKKTQKSVSSRKNKYESMTCRAVLSARSKVGEDEEMKEDAKDALGQALREEDLYVKDVRGELFVGNRGGLCLARTFAEVQAIKNELSRQNKKHEDEMALQKEELSRQNKKHEDKNTRLTTKVLSLAVSSKDHMQVRNRFISTFKRDKLKTANPSDYEIIWEGNLAAHGGDAILDAALYISLNKRSDIDTFEKLYGLTPVQVSRISEHQLSPSLKYRLANLFRAGINYCGPGHPCWHYFVFDKSWQ